MAKLPTDRFDQIAPARGVRQGAHRLPRRGGRFWRWLLSTTVVAVICAGTGVYLVDRYRNEIDLTGNGPRPVVTELPPYEIPVAEPVDDPKIAVTVLNATETAGLAAVIGKQLKDAKWNVKTESAAAQTDIATSTVYYNHLDAEGAARGLAAVLGVADVKLSTFYRGNPITVVVGADLVPAAV